MDQSPLCDCHREHAVHGRRRVGGHDGREYELGVREAEGLANFAVRFPVDLKNLLVVRAIDLEPASLRDQWSEIATQCLGPQGSVIDSVMKSRALLCLHTIQVSAFSSGS